MPEHSWTAEAHYLADLKGPLLKRARRHMDLQSGFPVATEAGECEVCDILWLIENGEGDRASNLFNLRDAMSDRPEAPDALP